VPMSGDEAFALFISSIIGVAGWWRWCGPLLRIKPPRASTAIGFISIAVPIAAFSLMLVILRGLAAHDVRDSTTYTVFYMLIWLAWTGITILALPRFGLSFRDDVMERSNLSAAIAIGGALIGITLAFGGGNVGDGPGWWVVLFSGGLATATLAALWMGWHAITGIADAITIDRDTASGWRAAGFFVGGGVIVGRAAAGNWISTIDTVKDFIVKGWPILILWALVVAIDWMLRPNASRPLRNAFWCGAIPAFAFIVIGLVAAQLQGPW